MYRSTWFAFLTVLLVSPTQSSFAQPANDDCSSPVLVVNLPASVPFNTTGATASTGLSLCGNMGEDIWYSVVAPADGLLEVRHNFNPIQHAVYRLPPGSICPTDLDQLYCDDPSNQNESYTPAVTGETYLIRLSRWQGGPASGILMLNVLPPPANDDCTSPQLLNLPDVVIYDAEGATGTPGLSCQISRDIWYAVTPSADGLISVNANPNNQPTAFGVNVAAYVSPGPSQCPVNADQVLCQGASSGSFQGFAGTTYLIRVGFAFGDDFPSALLAVSQTFTAPSNDDCSMAQPVTLPSAVPFDTTGATPDLSGLICNLHDDLWYGFAAPADGQIYVQLTGGGSFGHQIYRLPGGVGSCPTNFDPVSPCWNANESWTDITAGEVYAIRLGRSQPGPVMGTMNLAFVPALVNDDCSSPIALTIPSMSTVTTVGSTPDTTGLGCTNRPDSWYRFTIPASGLLHLEFGEFVVFGLYLHGAGCPTDADLVSCLSNDFGLIPVISGEEYLLRVATFNPLPPVTTDLNLEILQPAPNDDCSTFGALPIVVPTMSPIAWDNLTSADDVNGLACNVRRDLWYSFTAPADGCMEFFNDVDGSYAVYADPTAGSGCPTSSEIICFTANLGQIDVFDFPVAAGQSYLVRVGGSTANPLVGNFTLEYINCPPENVDCDSSVPGEVTASYSVPSASNYDLGVEIRLNGVLLTTVAQSQTSYTFLLPAGFAGVVQFGFRGISSTLGPSEEIRCSTAIGGVPNDLCVNATVVGVGSHVLDNSVAALDPIPLSLCTSFSNPTSDIWFSFTAPADELYTFSACATSFMPRIEVHSVSVCSGAAGTLLDCSVGCSLSYQATAGTTYILRVVASNFSSGVGTLNVVQDCAQLVGLNCSYDCVTNEVTLSWTGGSHVSYEVATSFGVHFMGLTSNSLVIANPAPGNQDILVRGFCSNGASTSEQCFLFIPNVSSPAPHLVLALEGVGSLIGFPGGIDSGAAIASTLLGLGERVSVLEVQDFDQFPCLSTFTDVAETIWVTLGTFPNDYRLSQAEGDLLASLAANGSSIYLEGADHWGVSHIDSQLDLRDGVEPDLFDNIVDGDDSFTAANGVDSGLPAGDFSGFVQLAYSQDLVLGDDRTDRLVLTGTDVTGNIPPDTQVTAGVCWVNFDDSMTGEPAYATGILAIHSDGGRMISSSFELGGLGNDPSAVVQAYLDFFEGVVPLPMFRRGDVNADNGINIADAVYLLGNLFPVGPPNPLTCRDAADGNNDGSINLADVVAILGSLFGMPPVALPAPHATCGTSAQAPNPTSVGCTTPTCP